ncbi:PD40 domain-containing protein [Paenibacillus tritici]|uniref:PD40 domain-containing protein n=1 Tax=Paenibacillus tritici TaxID=1873425 RepID=A0ABX2DRW5_9BACL|nr:PD40 domain-containing protein [Paenibacillus tritici]NQX46804.1 PD40 domain-containing protein [Paenibacillus tritici]
MNRESYRAWGKTWRVLLCGAVLLSVTACNTENTEMREVVETSGQKITVLDNISESVYTQLKLEGIHKVEGVRGTDFVSEEVMVVTQENRNLPAQVIEGQKRYPVNLYLHTFSTGEETPLREGELNYGAPLLSPDKTHLFYKELYEATGVGYIMDLSTGASVKLGDAEFRSEEGTWADDGHVIFPDMEGNLLSADVNGKLETVLKTGVSYAHEVIQTGSRILYISGEESQLNAYDRGTKQTKVLGQNVEWAIPSPDGSRLAIVERIGAGERVLKLCDSEGNEQSRLADGQQIFGTSWSPDGSKLAYAITAAGAADDQEGLFITEVETGEQTPVLNDIHIADKLHWSPSGKKLLASATVLKDSAYQSLTYVISLS